MENKYPVKTMFDVGDKVRVQHDRTYFDESVLGVELTVLEVVREDVDGREAVFYRTDKTCPVNGLFNEFELVCVN